MRWAISVFVAITGVAACKAEAPTAPPSEPKATTEPTTIADARPNASAPPEEPTPPWPVTVLDVPGHAPLPDEVRSGVWLTMNAMAATVTSGAIDEVATLRKGRPKRPTTDLLLPALYHTLAKPAESKVLMIWADERVPADTVLRVLYTGGRVGYREYAFVVGKPGARGIIEVHPPQINTTDTEFHGPAWADLELSWSTEGVLATVVARYSETGPQPSSLAFPLNVGEGDCIVPGGMRPSAETLGAVLDQVCTAGDRNPFALRVRLGQTESIGDVLWALSSDRRQPRCRLPAIVESGIDATPRRCARARSPSFAIRSFPSTYRDRGFADDDAEGDDQGKRVPRVEQGEHTVKGALDADIIRRIVRAHLNEVRYCYNQGLLRNAELEGQLVIVFTVGPPGKVITSKVASSSVENENVDRCVAKAVKRWKFPKPAGGGKVKIIYPFILTTVPASAQD